MNEDEADLLHCDILLEQDRPLEADRLLDTLLPRAPAEWRAHWQRARARLALADAPGALASAAEAVLLAPSLSGPKATLGIVLLALGRIPDANLCLAEAVNAAPDQDGFRLALAQARMQAGDVTGGRTCLADGLVIRPNARPLILAAMRAAVADGDDLGALDVADRACEIGAIDACILGLRGHVLSCLGRDEEASQAYAAALTLSPEDPYVRHLVAAAGIVAAPDRASPAYLRVLFDGFASHFDADLIRLRYRVPGLIRTAAAACHPPSGPVLDVGCGTGLVGLVLADIAQGPITGVDLSPAMLREAAAKGCYARLLAADVCADDEEQDGLAGPFGLIVAGDVLPYMGDPVPLLRAIRRRLAPGGVAVLSAEALPADAAEQWRLGSRARYAHLPAALCNDAERCGLRVVACRPEILRLDRGAPVAGMLLSLRAAEQDQYEDRSPP